MTAAPSELERAIAQATRQYFRLVLVVGAGQSGKTIAMVSAANNLGCQLINVNLELSKKMLELARSQRAKQAEKLMREVISSVPGEVVFLDNLGILFDPNLELEPLRLLQLSSRNRTVIASWNGKFDAGTLTYAEPGHPEFAQFSQIEAITITVGSIANS